MFTSYLQTAILPAFLMEVDARSFALLAGLCIELRRMGYLRKPDWGTRYDLRSELQT